MTAHNWITSATRQLQESGVGTARLDALVLLEDVSGHDRSYLLAHPEWKISDAQVGALKKLLTRRATHEPLAYVRGKTEFYGREFAVSAAVLEPRPESETMIELLINIVREQWPDAFGNKDHNTSHSELDLEPSGNTSTIDAANALGPSIRWDDKEHGSGRVLRIADVGTGSGALGITAKLEVPGADVELLEIDAGAMDVAKANVINHTTPIHVVKSNLLAHARKNNDVLLCNLPYVPDAYQINTAATHEPKIAIFGGPDGLDVYRQLFEQIRIVANKPLYILTEALPPQHDALLGIAKEHGYYQSECDDFIQVFRLNID